MKYSLFIAALFTSFAIHAQSSREEVPHILSFMSSMHFDEFASVANGYIRDNLNSRYTSSKTQDCLNGNGIWQDRDSAAFSYDSALRMTSHFIFKYDNGWKNSGKDEYKFDAPDYTKTESQYRWSEHDQQFAPVAEWSYNIDTINRKIIEETKYKYGHDSARRYWSREIYLFDAYGYDTLHTHEQWDNKAWKYVIEAREHMRYDTKGQMIYARGEYFSKTDKVWYDLWVRHYSYDKAGKEVMNDQYEYKKRVRDHGLIDSTFFDVQERATGERTYIYESKNNTIWMQSERRVYREDTGNPRDVTWVTWQREKAADTLSLREKHIKKYDSDTNLISRYEMLYDPDRGWYIKHHDSKFYDKRGNEVYEIDLTKGEMTDTFFQGTQTFYYYQPSATARAMPDDNGPSAIIFPNPYKSKDANLWYSSGYKESITIAIKDEKGSTMSSESRIISQGGNHILISHPELPAGTYQIEITNLHTGDKSLLKWIIE